MASGRGRFLPLAGKCRNSREFLRQLCRKTSSITNCQPVGTHWNNKVIHSFHRVFHIVMSTKQNNCSVFRVHRNTNTRQITALTPILSERKKCALSVPAESALYGATQRNESSGFLRRLRSRCRGVLRKLCGIAQWVSCTSCFWTVREPARYSVPQGQTDF